MKTAKASIDGDRIALKTSSSAEEFQEMVGACKSVGGGRFVKTETRKYWSYPLSVDTCLALRRAFGEVLLVENDLAAWYRDAAKRAEAQKVIAALNDAELTRVPDGFAKWLRGYQRAGAQWIASGYRDGGIVADKPGVGKTPETLAGLLEGDVRGPVLVVCPKASVRMVWGMEIKRHLPGVPVYLAAGVREKREVTLERFRRDMKKDPNKLRIVVVVAEMLRLEMGNPCVTSGGNKVSGMCKKRAFELECVHTKPPVDKKKWVPVTFNFPELFDPMVLHGGWSAVILDESHKLLGSLTLTKGNLMGRGLRMIPLRERAKKFALSGTPFGKGGRVEGMFGTLHWLWPDEYASFWRWAGQWFDIEEKVINRAGKTIQKINGLKGLRPGADPEEEVQAWEDFLKTLGPRILRRTKEEVMSELEPKTYVEVICEPTAQQKKQMAQLVEWAEITTHTGGIIMANGSLALLMRERQVSNGALTYDTQRQKVHFVGSKASGKIDRLLEALEARGILDGLPGDKLVIASNFNEFLDAIRDELIDRKVPHFQYDGRVPAARRDAMLHEWQKCDGKQRVFLVNTKAGGVSINLDAADEMHIMDEDPDPGVNEQLEDRIHRASRLHKVTIFYYRTEGSIDFKKAHDVEFRRKVQHAVLDGSRGVAYVREMLTEAFHAKGMED